MNSKLRLFALLFLPFNLFSQGDPAIDSLNQLLSQHTEADTIRVNLLNELGVEYWVVDPKESEYYGQQALTLADSLSYTSGVAYAYDVIGVAHWTQGKYTTALDYLINALTSYQRLGHTLYAANTMLNIGLIYYEQKDLELALQFFQEALSKYLVFGDAINVATALGNIGNVYFDMSEYNRADSSFREALELYKKVKDPYSIALSYGSLGDISTVTGQYNQALMYYQQSLELSREIGDLHGIAITLYHVGKMYREQQKFIQAEEYLMQSMDVARQVNDQKQLQDIYLELKELENARGNYKQAIRYFEQYIALKDTLFNEEKARQIAELQTVYETQQKEQEIALQNERIQTLNQKARTDSLLRYGLILGLIVLGTVAYLILSRQRLRIRKNREIYSAQQALTRAELENAKLKEAELAQKLTFKSKELTSYTVNFIQKSELFEELKVGLKQLRQARSDEVSKKVSSLTRLVDQHTNIDRDWEEFRRFFEDVHQDFLEKLRETYPDLTQGELKLCALLKLKMNLKEAASILGISPESVKTARYRLRKKLELNKEDDLIDFMQNFEASDSATVS
ncbi:tetratricopeptide repeat protein [Tunicatimonas pelagia]|uniref:tetratricopeptide repeat protein n=1 Tax=Tunicatimonas pelagia TaxID=931531 RepID=UPI0026666414|nr:tetratricopeptide repeat protein [Tunicatimonas pelagia]WKN43505.1 tetratricopeptide repeat protein [Tunicatimonas pelagia]